MSGASKNQGKTVRKAVIAAAGFGTRFLPQTKAMPKEMLPLVDKPIIQYVVEELAAAGIEDIIIVTGYHKRSIEDHFDYLSTDLRANLKQGGKLELLEQTKEISDLANFVYVRQKGPYGNATPILNTAHLVGDEPFIYTYADELMVANPNRFKQMIDLYNELDSSILPCIKASSDEDYKRYGILSGQNIKPGVVKMDNIVEKPGKDEAPSDLASVGGYLLTPDIFDYLNEAQSNLKSGEEFTIQPAMRAMINNGKSLYGCEIKDSIYYDTGDKLEYIKTIIDFALEHPDMKQEVLKHIKTKVDR